MAPMIPLAASSLEFVLQLAFSCLNYAAKAVLADGRKESLLPSDYDVPVVVACIQGVHAVEQ